MGGMGWTPRPTPRPRRSIKTLTRTDFLIQFLWKPTLAEELPEDPEERKAKLEESEAKPRSRSWIEKMKEAESQKNNSAVTIPSAEEIEKASKQKTTELESAITRPCPRSPIRLRRAAGAAAPAPGRGGSGVPGRPRRCPTPPRRDHAAPVTETVCSRAAVPGPHRNLARRRGEDRRHGRLAGRIIMP